MDAAMRGQVERAADLALAGDYTGARSIYSQILDAENCLNSRAVNDLAAIDAAEGQTNVAYEQLAELVSRDPACEVARENLALVRASLDESSPVPSSKARKRVAILSLLFNWPSTGGGIVHTVELAHFLECAGYEVQACRSGAIQQPSQLGGRRSPRKIDLDRQRGRPGRVSGQTPACRALNQGRLVRLSRPPPDQGI